MVGRENRTYVNELTGVGYRLDGAVKDECQNGDDGGDLERLREADELENGGQVRDHPLYARVVAVCQAVHDDDVRRRPADTDDESPANEDEPPGEPV